MAGRVHFLFALIASSAVLLAPAASRGQTIPSLPPPSKTDAPAPVIAIAPAADGAITDRLQAIFAQMPGLQAVTVNVKAGVVALGGETPTMEAASRAEAIAARVEGVVTVENNIERNLSVSKRLEPALGAAHGALAGAIRFLPLLIFAVLTLAVIFFVGWLLALFASRWRRLAPNSFIAELVQTSIRLIFFIFGVIAALRLLGATALLGAILGAAGVLGLAVGFAVRDTIENYIASIMLSLRQPFRPNDEVVIGDNEQARVIRLTSRATILMTLEGNHLRIPNAVVFKAVILNYTRNPERRFDFELGIGSDDDSIAAIDAGLATLGALDFILKSPEPISFIKDVGDSNIVLFFGAWIDQQKADFAKSRSAAIAKTKAALETSGFSLPEPIYRLRFDTPLGGVTEGGGPAARGPRRAGVSPTEPVDTAPDQHIARKVEEERRETGGEDLLNAAAPVE